MFDPDFVPWLGASTAVFLILGAFMLVRRHQFAQRSLQARPGASEKSRARAVRTTVLTGIGFLILGAVGVVLLVLTLVFPAT
jgi:hypothetical protein